MLRTQDAEAQQGPWVFVAGHSGECRSRFDSCLRSLKEG